MVTRISRRAERDLPAIQWRAVVLVGAAIASLVAGAIAVSRSSVFHARAIEVSGASHLSSAAVVGRAGVSITSNVPWLDEAEVERRLVSHRWVASADVEAALPWTIRIRVVERTPVAVALQGPLKVLVSGDGVVLGITDRSPGLPVIELPTLGPLEGARPPVRGATAVLEAMEPGMRAGVRRVVVQADGSVELWLSGRSRVRFGAPVGLARKLHALAQTMRWAEAQGEAIGAVSVVAPDAPAVTFRA